ncbi:hypothetical protein CIHG_07225 [Coccidioides immitis H538.4]|uniref:Uncharacterized protein n=2 Tax=Coccidioides immitis TaxID=5501 RepID=A0A0J8RZ27_COCIT|nr:hypothetical protein CIRG_09130 [Coccidioides immitis RMSCC 2394]KMU89419.1 hypothetical protein CIHG_07225 [Coccidioides immitis H538.4]
MWPALDQSIRRPLEPRTTSTLSPRAIPTADPSHVQTGEGGAHPRSISTAHKHPIASAHHKSSVVTRQPGARRSDRFLTTRMAPLLSVLSFSSSSIPQDSRPSQCLTASTFILS